MSAPLKAVLDEVFKYKLEDFVIPKRVVEECKLHAKAGDYKLPRVGQIVERIMQECPGGVQLHYTVALEGTNVRHLEQELMLASEVTFEEMAPPMPTNDMQVQLDQLRTDVAKVRSKMRREEIIREVKARTGEDITDHLKDEPATTQDETPPPT